MKNGIEVREVSKRFLTRSVLTRAKVFFAPGEITWISGANGSGKSTLLRILSGLLRPDEGSIIYDGVALTDYVTREATLPKIGAVLQRDMLYAELTVSENLKLFSEFCLAPRELKPLIESLQLEQHLDRRVRECSQGVRRKASLVRALVGDPQYLFLDEIFSHLDSEGIRATATLLKDASQSGKVVVVSGHEAHLANELASREVELSKGQVHDRREQ